VLDIINRSLIIVRPTQPFLDWVQSVDYDEQLTLEEVRHDPSAYLAPVIIYDNEQPALLEWCYEEVFEAELFSWYTDPALWPQNRDLKMFLEWFDVEFHSGVFDLCDEPIQIENYDTPDDDEPNSSGNGDSR
jgi:hypothetical protein